MGLGNQLLAAAGGWKGAAQALRKVGARRSDAYQAKGLFMEDLEGMVDELGGDARPPPRTSPKARWCFPRRLSHGFSEADTFSSGTSGKTQKQIVLELPLAEDFESQ